MALTMQCDGDGDSSRPAVWTMLYTKSWSVCDSDTCHVVSAVSQSVNCRPTNHATACAVYSKVRYYYAASVQFISIVIVQSNYI